MFPEIWGPVQGVPSNPVQRMDPDHGDCHTDSDAQFVP